MNGLEVLASLFGLINVTLVVRRSIWNYPFGLAMVTLYAVVFYRAKLYSDASLQLFFFAIQVYGWFAWSRVRAVAGEVVIGEMSARARIGWAAGTGLAIAVWGGLMHRFTDAAFPWWDAAVAILSVAAQLLMIKRRFESWWVWILVDVLSIGLYAANRLWPTMILYILFLVLAIWGLRQWSRARDVTSQVAV